MRVTRLEDVVDGERDVRWGNGQSRRLLLEADGTPFSITDTTVLAGTDSHLQYAHHVESCYCIEGSGEIEYDGERYALQPGTLYTLAEGEPHVLRAFTDLRLICVFVPPLVGPERHSLSDEGPSTYNAPVTNGNRLNAGA